MMVVLYLHLYHIKFLILFVIGISVKSVIKWVDNVDKTLRRNDNIHKMLISSQHLWINHL